MATGKQLYKTEAKFPRGLTSSHAILLPAKGKTKHPPDGPPVKVRLLGVIRDEFVDLEQLVHLQGKDNVAMVKHTVDCKGYFH